MNTMEIVKDALRYPLSDWKKLLILGIIIVINGISVFLGSVNSINNNIIWILASIGFIIGFLVNGYMFKIVKSSLDGKNELPRFNNWLNMGFDGIKIFLAFIIYSLPVILVLIPMSLPYIQFSSEEAIFNPFALLINPLISVIFSEILNLVMLLFNVFSLSLFIIPFIVYVIVIIPIFLVAIANMAYYEGKFKSAFKIREIIEEISLIGWAKLIKLYLALMAVILIYIITGNIISYISSFSHLNFVNSVTTVLFYLILTSYFCMILARLVGLFYMPDKDQDIIEEESISQGKFIKDYQ